MENSFNHPKRTPRGAALILTVLILSMLTVLVVGFLSSMQTERKAAHAYEDSQRAKLIAQGAVSHAIDLLRTNIPDPARVAEKPASATGENWVTNPGRLTVLRSDTAPVYIPLHTGEVTQPPPTDAPKDAESVDLNKPLPGQTTPAIVPATNSADPAPVMRVKWVPLLQSPELPASTDNRLIGRYAFWMDDESTKINFNTAVGKPPDNGASPMHRQLEVGFQTPIFALGDQRVESSVSENYGYALGKPESVNLDVLLDDPTKLKRDDLLASVLRRGYARYPEAIMDFVDLPNAREWYERNKYNLSFYNRSPEFNAFGFSRWFTTYVPLSLEAGPAYQHSFIHDTTGQYNANSSQVFHFPYLFGYLGFDHSVTDPNGVSHNSTNRVARYQIDTILRYLTRKWPGYDHSFVDKYGWDNCVQMALDIMHMARMGTSEAAGAQLASYTKSFTTRSSSAVFSPPSNERSGHVPERHYWTFFNPYTQTNKQYIPQFYGPKITEIRFFVRPMLGSGGVNTRVLQYYFEAEYYAPPLSPVVDLEQFITRTDYLGITATGTTNQVTQEFGIANPSATSGQRNWNSAPLSSFQIVPPAGTLLGPDKAQQNGTNVPNRLIVRSPIYTVGTALATVPAAATAYKVFNVTTDGVVRVNVAGRFGVALRDQATRPLQMMPLGETLDDTLKASFQVNLHALGVEQVISWQISDPRLSGYASNWLTSPQGTAFTSGTPGAVNSNEPAEDSSEKSKYRHVQRAHAQTTIGGQSMERWDEYNSASRVTSPGYFSIIHTGVHSANPWRTLDLRAEAQQNSPPDWLLLDLFGMTAPMSRNQWHIESNLPDQFSTASHMNSTAGQVNVNSRIYPQNDYFKAPPRTKPIEAVFKNLKPDTELEQLIDQIQDYQTDTQVFDYVGELSNVPGIADTGSTQWQQESLIRNMAGVLTTRTNTFGVWGVAQTVRKARSNGNHASFEKGDQVTGEKRFYALVERYIWPGRDGMPGNAHVNTLGKWDRLAEQSAKITATGATSDTPFQLPGSPPLSKGSGVRLSLDVTGSYPEFDGPEHVGADLFMKGCLADVRYRQSSLEDAYNPPQALIKYRVVYFKYLDQ